MNPIELKALQKTRLNLLGNLDIDHVKDHLIQYEVSSIKHRHSFANRKSKTSAPNYLSHVTHEI